MVGNTSASKFSTWKNQWRHTKLRLFEKTPGAMTFNILLYFFFILFSIMMIYPFLYVVLESLENGYPYGFRRAGVHLQPFGIYLCFYTG